VHAAPLRDNDEPPWRYPPRGRERCLYAPVVKAVLRVASREGKSSAGYSVGLSAVFQREEDKPSAQVICRKLESVSCVNIYTRLKSTSSQVENLHSPG